MNCAACNLKMGAASLGAALSRAADPCSRQTHASQPCASRLLLLLLLLLLSFKFIPFSMGTHDSMGILYSPPELGFS